MLKIALFPGSFDPITKGHEDIVKRALPLFDNIIIGIGIHPNKNYLFSLEKRINWIKKTFEKSKKVNVQSYKGLTVDFCKKINTTYIVRGLRSQSDFEFEKNIAQMNRAMSPEIETIFIVCDPKLSAISSSIVRDIIRNSGNAKEFIPDVLNADNFNINK